MATKNQIGTRTHASAVSKQLRRLGYNPYGAHENRHGGYIVRAWAPLDTQGGPIVQVRYDGIHRELKGAAARKHSECERARLERMGDMMEDLKTIGYFVVWGWDLETGKTDNTFLAVSGSPARRTDIPEAEEVVIPQEVTEEPQEAPQEELVARVFPFVPLMSLEDAEVSVQKIQNVSARDPEVARRMESHLYYQALVAVVGGSPDAVDVCATVLQTQGLLLPR